MFDEDNLYFAARVWDTAPPSQWVANEMRRDSRALFQNDTFGMSFDTFYDRHNGYFFYTNALGGMTDQEVRPDGPNIDWNTVWDARTEWRLPSSRFGIGLGRIRCGACNSDT